MERVEMSNAMARVIKHLIKDQPTGMLKDIIEKECKRLKEHQCQRVYDDIIQFVLNTR